MRAAFIAASLGLAAALLPVPARAQGQPWMEKLTCTETRNLCESKGYPKDQCAVMHLRCLKTGRWVGIVSGTDQGPRIKR